MRIHQIILSLIFLCGCSNQGDIMEKDSKEITLSTGNQFASALVENRYSDACSMLTAELQKSWPPEKLESRYKEMIAYGGEPVIVDGHTAFMDNWPDKKTGDIGWVYVSVSGNTFGEAVTLIVTIEMGEPKIRNIEWGRP